MMSVRPTIVARAHTRTGVVWCELPIEGGAVMVIVVELVVEEDVCLLYEDGMNALWLRYEDGRNIEREKRENESYDAWAGGRWASWMKRW